MVSRKDNQKLGIVLENDGSIKVGVRSE